MGAGRLLYAASFLLPQRWTVSTISRSLSTDTGITLVRIPTTTSLVSSLSQNPINLRSHLLLYLAFYWHISFRERFSFKRDSTCFCSFFGSLCLGFYADLKNTIETLVLLVKSLQHCLDGFVDISSLIPQSFLPWSLFLAFFGSGLGSGLCSLRRVVLHSSISPISSWSHAYWRAVES